jgi:hypothetical protein
MVILWLFYGDFQFVYVKILFTLLFISFNLSFILKYLFYFILYSNYAVLWYFFYVSILAKYIEHIKPSTRLSVYMDA